jgi:hypothetical protein
LTLTISKKRRLLYKIMCLNKSIPYTPPHQQETYPVNAPLDPPFEKQTLLAQFENTVKHVLIFGTSLIFWAVIGVHLSYHPVLVFGMIALYNEHLRDYWSILARQSREYGVWPGLLDVFRQEVLWIFTITLGLTVAFWILRRTIGGSKESFTELLGSFVWEQVLALGVAVVACTLGAIGVGTSLIFGVLSHTPISLEIAVIIEIVASSLLIFSLMLSLSFLYFDLPRQPKTRQTARWVFFSALPIAAVGLYWASQSFSLETQFTSDPPLPADFLIYSADTVKNIPVGNDQGPEIEVFDHVSTAGQTHLSAAETLRFSWPNSLDNMGSSVMRSLYFAGSDIVPDFMPALYHRRPTTVELDLEDRVIQLGYHLKLQRSPSKTLAYPPSGQPPADWGTLSNHWHQKDLSGPANGGWGTRLFIAPDPETPAAEQVASYTVFATAPPRLETQMQDGKRYQRRLPFKGPIQSLSWHRQSAASLWINNTPAFYFFDGQPQGVEAVNPRGIVLHYTDLEFVPES